MAVSRFGCRICGTAVTILREGLGIRDGRETVRRRLRDLGLVYR